MEAETETETESSSSPAGRPVEDAELNRPRLRASGAAPLAMRGSSAAWSARSEARRGSPARGLSPQGPPASEKRAEEGRSIDSQPLVAGVEEEGGGEEDGDGTAGADLVDGDGAQ
jgi:hypothetical protein